LFAFGCDFTEKFANLRIKEDGEKVMESKGKEWKRLAMKEKGKK